ncbi:MAG: linear amide C-N hydrolase [Anaerolineae bacterium]|nr:linear amide C-N hydrolase [Anaerolineae bacterium]
MIRREEKDGYRKTLLTGVIAFILFAGLLGAVTWLRNRPTCTGTVDDHTRTLESVEQVANSNLYTMTYYGDYGLDAFMQTGISAASGDLTSPAEQAASSVDSYQCSTFVTRNEKDDVIVARNFDYYHDPALLLFTDPPDGYASASIIDIHYLGFWTGIDAADDLTSLIEAPYWPFDGMNEHGLDVTLMAVPHIPHTVDRDRVVIGSLHLIRILLDNAATVDEAIALAEQFSMDWEGGEVCHYLVADRNGDSAVLEYVDSELVVIRPDDPFQISTNFYLHDTDTADRIAQCPRYATAHETLSAANGILTNTEITTLTEQIAGENNFDINTMWSVIYNLTTGDITVYMALDFDHPHTFTLDMAAE